MKKAESDFMIVNALAGQARDLRDARSPGMTRGRDAVAAKRFIASRRSLDRTLAIEGDLPVLSSNPNRPAVGAT